MSLSESATTTTIIQQTVTKTTTTANNAIEPHVANANAAYDDASGRFGNLRHA